MISQPKVKVGNFPLGNPLPFASTNALFLACRFCVMQKDSGAIVVCAGVPPTNHFDIDSNYQSIGVPRSRIWFSNYGKILNVQAWGWHVTTLGYGDAQGGASENTWYTLRFSGTSSASPIVTGSVACLQGRASQRTAAR